MKPKQKCAQKKVSFRKKKQRRARPNEGKKHHAQSKSNRRLKAKEGKERSQGRYGSGIWVYGPCVLWQLPPKVAIWNMQFGSWLQRKTQETSNPWAQHARRTYVMWSEQKPIKKFRWPHNDQTGTWTDHLTKSQISSLNQSWEQKSKTVAKKNEK